MERIRLNDDEKSTLRRLSLGKAGAPDGMPPDRYTEAVVTLTEKRLVRSVINYDEVVGAKLTAKGRAYLNSNPHLRNPINWSVVGAVAMIVTAVASVIALFIACGRIIN